MKELGLVGVATGVAVGVEVWVSVEDWSAGGLDRDGVD